MKKLSMESYTKMIQEIERKEDMRKRNKDRKELEEELRKSGYKYITRAAHGEVCAHRTPPKREINFWSSKDKIALDSLMYNGLSWHDEPLYIGKDEK